MIGFGKPVQGERAGLARGDATEERQAPARCPRRYPRGRRRSRCFCRTPWQTPPRPCAYPLPPRLGSTAMRCRHTGLFPMLPVHGLILRLAAAHGEGEHARKPQLVVDAVQAAQLGYPPGAALRTDSGPIAIGTGRARAYRRSRSGTGRRFPARRRLSGFVMRIGYSPSVYMAYSFAYTPPLAKSCLVRALLLHAVFGEHPDGGGVFDGGQPVGDGKRGAPHGERFQRSLHQPLALVVQRAGGLVQNQDRRVFQEHARDGHALFLPAGELHPALAHAGLVAVGQRA